MSKGIAAGLIIGLLLGTGLGFGLLYLFPNQTGNVIQTKFSEFSSDAIMSGTTTTEALIPDTTLSITTSGSSYLLIRFHTMYMVRIDSGASQSQFLIKFRFNNDVKRIAWLVHDPPFVVLNYSLDISGFLTIEYVTEVIPAGSHTVNMTWRSRSTTPGTSLTLWDSLYDIAGITYNRSLLIQEIHI